MFSYHDMLLNQVSINHDTTELHTCGISKNWAWISCFSCFSLSLKTPFQNKYLNEELTIAVSTIDSRFANFISSIIALNNFQILSNWNTYPYIWIIWPPLVIKELIVTLFIHLIFSEFSWNWKSLNEIFNLRKNWTDSFPYTNKLCIHQETIIQ